MNNYQRRTNYIFYHSSHIRPCGPASLADYYTSAIHVTYDPETDRFDRYNCMIGLEKVGAWYEVTHIFQHNCISDNGSSIDSETVTISDSCYWDDSYFTDLDDMSIDDWEGYQDILDYLRVTGGF